MLRDSGNMFAEIIRDFARGGIYDARITSLFI